MRHYLILLVACWAASSSLAQAADPVDPREQEIRDFEKKWELALNAGDVATIEPMVGKEFTLIGPDGKGIDREAYLKTIPPMKGRTVWPKVNRVDFYGDTAVAFGEVHVKKLRDGRPVEFTLIWIDVLVRRDDRWQVVAVQATNLNPKWYESTYVDGK